MPTDAEQGEQRRSSRALLGRLKRAVIGQPTALEYIVPYVQTYEAGLSPGGRPVGVFLLLGPTGTGKTRTVEALADALHGSASKILKIDCAEFQSEHEVAKLIGAPPGYVGHREAAPRLTRASLLEATSEHCDLSLVLFDEIEKAAPSVSTLLLGVLDRGTLRLGDGALVEFDHSLVFLTSNLGAREMARQLRPGLGIHAARPRLDRELRRQLERIGRNAVRKRFSPEFMNRIDCVLTYQPLDAPALAQILDQQIGELQQHVHTRLGRQSFDVEVDESARGFLLERGTSLEYGARELKRTIHRFLTQPLAVMVAEEQVPAGASVSVRRSRGGDTLSLECRNLGAARAPDTPCVLAVDDNGSLLRWLERVLSASGYRVLPAENVEQARAWMERESVDLALLDYVLPDGDGVQLGVELHSEHAAIGIVLMTGIELPEEDALICDRHDFPVLLKPFLVQDVLGLLEASLLRGGAATRDADVR